MSSEGLRGQEGVYRLDLGVLRGGGQALVYAAYREDDAAQTRCAVKLARRPADSRWLARERDALRAIAAENPGAGGWVVALLDHGETPDGRVFLVLPWFEQTLGGWVQSPQPPDLRRRLVVLASACAAVVRLHRSAADLSAVRVHRDIKPDNLLITAPDSPTPAAILADLGGVKEGRLLAAGHHTVLHTPSYAPPEQTLPLEQAPDPAMDVHALAATLFWTLTGAPPESILQRQAARTPAGRPGRPRAAQPPRPPVAAGEALRRRELADLIALDQVVALTDSDEIRLKRALRDLLPDQALLQPMLRVLLPSLRHALEPLPRQRAGDARKLLAACELCRDLLPPPVSEVAPRPPPVPHEKTVLVPDPVPTLAPPPAPALQRRWPLALLLLGLLVGLGGLGLVGFGALLSAVTPAPEAPLSPPEATLPPDPVPAAEPPAPAPEPTPPAPTPAPAPEKEKESKGKKGGKKKK